MPQESYVSDIFRSIYSKYDLLDSLISLGLDNIWRKRLISMIRIHDNSNILDCGAGTGKLSALLRRKFPGSRIVALDISKEMLSVVSDTSIETIVGSAVDMPFEDNSFDLVTCAFLTRNVPDRKKFFTEVKRVLRDGGEFVTLDIHNPKNRGFSILFSIYFDRIVPRIGDVVSRSGSYSYLSKSVRGFISPEDLEIEAESCGLTSTGRRLMGMGSISISRFIKIMQQQ